MSKRLKMSRTGSEHEKLEPTPNTHLARPFFQFPAGIRFKVYFYVFSSTRISYGRRVETDNRTVQIVPAPHSLALLRTCRQIKQEVGDTWLGQVLFNFECQVAMLDKLTIIPTATLSKIKFLRIRNDLIGIQSNGCYTSYTTAGTLKFLPGLSLDRLTVLACTSIHPGMMYVTGDDLVRGGDGWRELHLVSPGASPTSRQSWGNHFSHGSQSGEWPRMMEDRDGASSKPSVTVYLPTPPNHHRSSVVCQRSRLPYEQALPTSQESFEHWEVEGPPYHVEKNNDVLIVIKRGAGVDYEMKPDPQGLGRFSPSRQCKTWKEVRERNLNICTNTHMMGEDDDESVEIDCYENAGEYTWTWGRRYPSE